MAVRPLAVKASIHKPTLSVDDRALVAALAPQPGERILDFGSDAGQRLRLIAGYGGQCTGIDSSLSRLRTARRWSSGALVVQSDLVQALPLASRFFDAILFVVAGEHLEHLPEIALELHRVLRARGRLVVALNYPALEPLSLNSRRNRRKDFDELDHTLRSGPFRYRAKDYWSALAQAGFTDLRHHEVNSRSGRRYFDNPEKLKDFPPRVILHATRHD